MSMEDFSNSESPVWHNVAYEDEATKQSITKQTHSEMVSSGNVVVIPNETIEQVGESYPDLRGIKKKDRVELLKDSVNRLKNNLRQFLSGFRNQTFEFDVNGNVLEAKLYTRGINEVTEKLTEQKANMLYSSSEIFRNAKYLYSTPSYDSDPNIYRWNYFYTPVQIGDETVGVRIAIRDVITPSESQIYHWGIKKDTPLDGEGRGTNNRIPHGVSLSVSENIINSTKENVNNNFSLSPQTDTFVKSDSAESPYSIKNTPVPTVLQDEVTGEYLEKTAQIQRFDADLSKYSERERYIVQKAINSNVVNNSASSHRIVDLMAKIYAEKGIDFIFVNDTTLRQMGFSLENRRINGVYTPNGIYLNVDSPDLANVVLGHEITHAFEGTKLYDELQKAIVKYAQMKGDYTAKLEKMQSLYGGVETSNVNAELTAELVGQYLFTDESFINSLAVNNRNLFQRIWDEIKYISRLVTAGTPEARQLERVRHTFEKAYNSSAVKNVGEGNVKYSIVENFEDNNGIHYDSAVLLDTDFFEGLSPRNWGKKLKEHIATRSANNPFIMPIVDENGITQQLQFASPSERVTKEGKSNHKVIDELWETPDNISKLSVIHIDEIIEISEKSSPYYTSNNQHQWLDKNGWLHRNAYVINNKNGAIYNVTIDIAKAKDGRTILYATNGKIKRVGNVQVNSLIKRGSGQNSNSADIITSPNGNVNNNFSLSPQSYASTANQGTPLNSLRYNPEGDTSSLSEYDSDGAEIDGTAITPQKSAVTIKDQNERTLNELNSQLESLGYERQEKSAEYDSIISSKFASLSDETPGSLRYEETARQIVDLLIAASVNFYL